MQSASRLWTVAPTGPLDSLDSLHWTLHLSLLLGRTALNREYGSRSRNERLRQVLEVSNVHLQFPRPGKWYDSYFKPGKLTYEQRRFKNVCQQTRRCYFHFPFLVISPFVGGDLFPEHCVFLIFVKPLGAVLYHYNPTEKTKKLSHETRVVCPRLLFVYLRLY